MGLKFFENSGAYEGKTYHCASCQIYLTSIAEVVSTAFRGVTGDAILFKSAKNVSFGRMEEREMLTGKHFVRDVFCGSCSENLGWTYELAVDQREQYKEGCIILEKMHIIESDENGVLPDRHIPSAIRRATGMAIPGRHPDYMRHHHRLFNIYRIRNEPGLAIPYFRRNVRGGLPQATIYNEQELVRHVGGPHQLDAFRRSLRRFNQAIQKCCDEGHNRDLLAMGFQRQLAAGYANISEMMERSRYTPSTLGDQNLVLLFDQMRDERRRLDRMEIPFDDIIMGIHEFQDEVDRARRDVEQIRAAPMAAILGNPQAIREVLRERIEDYGFNGALADDDLLFRRRPGAPPRPPNFPENLLRRQGPQLPMPHFQRPQDFVEEERRNLMNADNEIVPWAEVLEEEVEGDPFDINDVVDPGID